MFRFSVVDGIGFGPYPSPKLADHLISSGFEIFVDLTEIMDTRYDFPMRIHFPIIDREIPRDLKSFDTFINTLIFLYHSGKRLFIHCKHGKGRTSTILIILLARIHNLPIEEIIQRVNNSYRKGHGAKTARTLPKHAIQARFIREYLERFSVDLVKESEEKV